MILKIFEGFWGYLNGGLKASFDCMGVVPWDWQKRNKKVWRRAVAEPHPEMTPSLWWPLHLHYAVQHLRLKKTPYPAAARSWDLEAKCPVLQACYAIMPCCCFGSVAKRKVGCWMLPAGLDLFIVQAQRVESRKYMVKSHHPGVTCLKSHQDTWGMFNFAWGIMRIHRIQWHCPLSLALGSNQHSQWWWPVRPGEAKSRPCLGHRIKCWHLEF